MYTLEGVSSVANLFTAYEASLYNRDSYFLICNLVSVFDDYVSVIYLLHNSMQLNFIKTKDKGRALVKQSLRGIDRLPSKRE